MGHQETLGKLENVFLGVRLLQLDAVRVFGMFCYGDVGFTEFVVACESELKIIRQKLAARDN